MDRLWPAIRNRLLSAGLEVDVRQSDHGFAKMSVTDLATGETTQVDVGFDPAAHASIALSIGPVRALDDLAGDKLLALFGRAAPRDFVDVHALRARFTRRTLEPLAAAKDLGFNLAVLRDAFGVLDDRPRSAFEVDDATFALIRAAGVAARDRVRDRTTHRAVSRSALATVRQGREFERRLSTTERRFCEEIAGHPLVVGERGPRGGQDEMNCRTIVATIAGSVLWAMWPWPSST